MSFLDELQKATNKTTTENGAVTNASSLNPVLDFFSQAGAMRDRVEDAVKLFKCAYAADNLLALRALFYLRDVRGGQGERTLFRECLQTIPVEIVMKNLDNIPEFGRYDDLLVLDIETISEFIRLQLLKDLENCEKEESISLLAKWMPSENTSSSKTRKLATKLRTKLGLSPIQYRKLLVLLRKHIVLLEQKMSSKKWGEIDYEKTPSQASVNTLKLLSAMTNHVIQNT